MQQVTQPGEGRIARLPSDFPALTTVFLLIVGFTFSDDLVEFLLDVTGNYDLAATNRQYIAFVVGIQALSIGLAAMVWLLLVDAMGQE